MTANEFIDLEQAWPRATDADVRRALLDLDEMHPAAVPIVEAEAARRGIGPATIKPPIAGPRIFLTGCRASWSFLKAHRVLSAVLLGGITFALAFLLSPLWAPVHPALQVAFFFVLFLAGDVVACWPLQDLRRVFSYCLAFGIPAFGWQCASVLSIWYQWGGTQGASMTYPLIGLFIGALLYWMLPLALLSLVVWFRRTYRPVYPPGTCQRCGYDLTGLTLRRCPECGSAFESEVVASQA